VPPGPRDCQAEDAEVLHLLDELFRVRVAVLELTHDGLYLAVDEVADEPDHGSLVLVQLIHACSLSASVRSGAAGGPGRLGRNRRSVPAAFSQVQDAGSVFSPRTQSASLAFSWSAEGGRAGEPGGNCWLARRIVPLPVWISASSWPSRSRLPPGSSSTSTRLTSRRAASRRTAWSVKLSNPGYASSTAAGSPPTRPSHASTAPGSASAPAAASLAARIPASTAKPTCSDLASVPKARWTPPAAGTASAMATAICSAGRPSATAAPAALA